MKMGHYLKRTGATTQRKSQILAKSHYSTEHPYRQIHVMP